MKRKQSQLETVRKGLGITRPELGLHLARLHGIKTPIPSRRIYDWERDFRKIPEWVHQAIPQIIFAFWDQAKRSSTEKPEEIDEKYIALFDPAVGGVLKLREYVKINENDLSAEFIKQSLDEILIRLVPKKGG